ncbi:MAG: transcription antitermination factor NusB, partial [Acidobacteriaceae bacterium]
MSSAKDSASGHGKPVSAHKKFAGPARRKPATAPAAQPAAQPPAPRPVTAARSIAFDILQRIAAGKGHCDELLQERLVWPLSQEDRNLATALVMGVLRWQIRLDALVQPLLARPSQRLPEPVAIALRMGAFQLLYMDRIPAHAAISESVELCRAADQPHATGMVNAVLRKIALTPKASQSAAAETKPPQAAATAAPIAARFAHPLWLVERWVAAYGPANA